MRTDQSDNYRLFLYSRNAQPTLTLSNLCSMRRLYIIHNSHSATFILFKDILFFTHSSTTCDDLSSRRNDNRLRHRYVLL
jgi:hypothetical protein